MITENWRLFLSYWVWKQLLKECSKEVLWEALFREWALLLSYCDLCRVIIIDMSMSSFSAIKLWGRHLGFCVYGGALTLESESLSWHLTVVFGCAALLAASRPAEQGVYLLHLERAILRFSTLIPSVFPLLIFSNIFGDIEMKRKHCHKHPCSYILVLRNKQYYRWITFRSMLLSSLFPILKSWCIFITLLVIGFSSSFW